MELPYLAATALIEAGYNPLEVALGAYEVFKGAAYVGSLAYQGGKWAWSHLPEQHWENLPFYPTSAQHQKTPLKRHFRGGFLEEEPAPVLEYEREFLVPTPAPAVLAKRFKDDIQRQAPALAPLPQSLVVRAQRDVMGRVYTRRRGSYRRRVYRRRYVRRPRISSLTRGLILRSIAEPKYLITDHDHSGTVGFTASVIDCVNTLQQGTDQSTRVGNRIAITGMHMRGYLKNNASENNSTFRVIVFQDKECRGAACALSDLLQNSSIAGPFAPYRLENVPRRFHIIKDLTFPMVNPIDGTSLQRPFRLSLKFRRPLITQFRGNAGTISDIVSASLCVAWIYSSDSNKGTVKVLSQLCFRDV